MWDGEVQLAGTDPYRYPPSSPAAGAAARAARCSARPDHCPYAFPGGCTSINRPDRAHHLPAGGRGGVHRAPAGCRSAATATTCRCSSRPCSARWPSAWLLLRRGPPWRAARLGLVPGGGDRVREQRAHRLAGVLLGRAAPSAWAAAVRTGGGPAVAGRGGDRGQALPGARAAVADAARWCVAVVAAVVVAARLRAARAGGRART